MIPNLDKFLWGMFLLLCISFAAQVLECSSLPHHHSRQDSYP